MTSQGNSTQADHYQDAGTGSTFIHATVEETAVSVLAFIGLMAFIVALASVAFGWQWLPRVFLTLLAVSAALLFRSRLMGRKPAYYEESMHLTTITVGLMGSAILLVDTLT